MTNIDFKTVIPKFDEALSRGLSRGLGKRDGQMCIEAAICYALDLPHGDQPNCVTEDIIPFKTTLNDSIYWKSPESRAKHLRNLGIAQLGSKGVIPYGEFTKKIVDKTIRILIPKLFREIYPNELVELVDNCEKLGGSASINKLSAASASYAAYAAAYAYASASAAAASAYDSAYAYASASAAAAYAASAYDSEKYLILSAELALESLKELKSPGCEWL